MCKKEVHMYRAILCNNMAFVLNEYRPSYAGWTTTEKLLE